MASLGYALSCSLVLLSLLNLILSATDTVTHNTDGCQLVTRDEVELTTSVIHNGQTYTDITITIPNEYRGYKCRQSASTASGETHRCNNMHFKDQSYAATPAGGTEVEIQEKYMCRPSATVTVTKTVLVSLGGGISVNKDVEWSNITECACDHAL